LDPPQNSSAMAIRSFGDWPDWIGKLNAEFPPAIVEAGSDGEATEETEKEEGWPSWIGEI